MSKVLWNYMDAAYEISTETPDSYHYYTGEIYLTNWERLVFFLDVREAKGRKITSAKLKFVARSEDKVYLELYSGNECPNTYNELQNNCTRHAWTGSTSKIPVDMNKSAWNEISLSNYSSGISSAINSGDYLIIVITPDETAKIEVSDTYESLLEIECERLDPTVSNLSPNGENIYLNKIQKFSWYLYADGAYQDSCEFGWSSDNGNTWNTISKETSLERIEIPAYTFPEGTIQWRVKTVTSEGKESSFAYASFVSIKQIPSVAVSTPNGIEISNDKSYQFSWTYSGEDLTQISYEIGWSSDGGNTWNDIMVESSADYHTFAAGEFPAGTIQWRIRATNSDGYSSEYSYGEFVCVAKLPSVQIEFPNGLNIPNSTEQIFTWIYDGNELLQKSYEIGWSPDDGTTWNTVTGENSNTYHVFEANTFPVGNINWRIKVTNSEDYSSDYTYGSFKSIGKGEAPVIENITQNAIPEITWSVEYQAAFEVQIKKNGEIIFSTGFIGGEENEYRPNIMLENGNYIIQVRIMNSYGYISEWGVAAFVLEAEIPNSTAILKLGKNAAFGACLTCDNIIGNGYIVRIEDGREEIIGKFSENEICDYHTKGEKTYIYVLRDHVDGYCDTQRVEFKADFTGVILHDASNFERFINIRLSESDYVIADDSMTKNTVYKNCIGRAYPVKETNNQRTETITVTGFLNDDECDLLRTFYSEDITVLMRSRNYCFMADISSYKESRYLDKGYMVQVTLTRIDEESEVELI